jgi:hypothetical protein
MNRPAMKRRYPAARAALMRFILDKGALGLLGWRRKRKQAAA